MFQYSKDIDHLLSDIQEKGPIVIKKYEDILNDKGQKMLKFGSEEEQEYLRKIQNLKDKCSERLDEIESDKYYILN